MTNVGPKTILKVVGSPLPPCIVINAMCCNVDLPLIVFQPVSEVRMASMKNYKQAILMYNTRQFIQGQPDLAVL